MVKHYQADELVGKKVLIVSNLAAADLRGVQSEGMLLTAETRKNMEVIEVSGIEPGTEVLLEKETLASSADEITIEQFLDAEIKIEKHQMRIGELSLMLNGVSVETQRIEKGKVK